MPGYKNWIDGAILTEADLDDYVGKQVVMKMATNAARDAALTAGTGKRENMVTIQDDTNCMTVSTGTGVGTYSTIGPVHGALLSWTPAITQLGAVTCTVTAARYTRTGRWITAWFDLAVTGSGTAANAVNISLPVTAASGNAIPCGITHLFDTSVGTVYSASPRLNSTTTFDLWSTSVDSADQRLGVAGFTLALASGDSIKGKFEFEAAADA